MLNCAGGKKKTKSKGKTLNLNEFLANDGGVVPAPVVTHRSWAAEMDNADGEGELPVVIADVNKDLKNFMFISLEGVFSY